MYGLAMPYYHVADGFTGKTHVWHSTGFCFVFFKALCKVVWCEATGMLRFGGTCIQFLLTNRDLRRHTSSHLSATLYGFLFWMLKKKRWRNHVLLDGAIGVSFWPSLRCLIPQDVDLSHWLTWILGHIHLCFKRKESRPLVSTAVCSNRYFPPKVIPQTNHQHDLQPHLSSDQSPGWLGYIKGLYYRREIIIKPIISPQRCRSPLT